MLAGSECRESDRCVEVRPGGHQDCIDRRIGDQGPPVGIGLRDAELPRGGRGGLRAPIDDAGQLNVLNCPKAGDVAGPGDSASPHDPDPEPFAHLTTPYKSPVAILLSTKRDGSPHWRESALHVASLEVMP